MIMKLLIELVSQGPRAVGVYTNCVLQNNVKKKKDISDKAYYTSNCMLCKHHGKTIS